MNTWNLTVMDLIIIYQIFFAALHFFGEMHFPSLPHWLGLGHVICFSQWSINKHDCCRGTFWLLLIPLTFTWIKHALGIHYYKEGEKKTLISLRLNLSLYPRPAVPLHEAELPSSANLLQPSQSACTFVRVRNTGPRKPQSLGFCFTALMKQKIAKFTTNIYWIHNCDIVTYNSKFIFGLNPISGTELPKPLQFPKWSEPQKCFFVMFLRWL